MISRPAMGASTAGAAPDSVRCSPGSSLALLGVVPPAHRPNRCLHKQTGSTCFPGRRQRERQPQCGGLGSADVVMIHVPPGRSGPWTSRSARSLSLASFSLVYCTSVFQKSETELIRMQYLLSLKFSRYTNRILSGYSHQRIAIW